MKSLLESLRQRYLRAVKGTSLEGTTTTVNEIRAAIEAVYPGQNEAALLVMSDNRKVEIIQYIINSRSTAKITRTIEPNTMPEQQAMTPANTHSEAPATPEKGGGLSIAQTQSLVTMQAQTMGLKITDDETLAIAQTVRNSSNDLGKTLTLITERINSVIQFRNQSAHKDLVAFLNNAYATQSEFSVDIMNTFRTGLQGLVERDKATNDMLIESLNKVGDMFDSLMV